MRCGFLYKLSDLAEQYEWAGPSLYSKRILVCMRTCLDVPQEQLRTIIIGPDPVPPRNPSPTFYAQQNQGGVPGPTMYPPLPDDPPLGPDIIVTESGEEIVGG